MKWKGQTPLKWWKDYMIEFDDIWKEGIVSFDTCSLGRMYEWESIYAVNIKDALSYLWKIGKLWETEINIQEFSVQRIAFTDIYPNTQGIPMYYNESRTDV